MRGGFAALLIIFGVPHDQIGALMDQYTEDPAVWSEQEAVDRARQYAREMGYLDD